MTLNTIILALKATANSRVIMLVILAVICDTTFGFIRAIKEHKFNSCFGIDGAIRKISMIISLCFLVVVDCLINVNLISFIPEQARIYIGLEEIGTATFFGILYLCYEAVSILKNMYLCGLPVRKIWRLVKKFLENYTDELPDEDEIVETEKAKKSITEKEEESE